MRLLSKIKAKFRTFCPLPKNFGRSGAVGKCLSKFFKFSLGLGPYPDPVG